MGFSSYGYRSESESAIDNEVPLYLSGQNKQAVSRVAPAASDGGTDIFADELIQEHAGGKILRLGYGPQETPTWVFEATADGVSFGYPITPSNDELTAAIINRIPINVKEWGVVADGSDCTPAINAILQTYRAMAYPTGIGLDLYFPPGLYSVSSINATLLNSVQVRGVPGGTCIYGDQQTGSSKPILDLSGSNNLRVIGLTLFGTVYGSLAPPESVGGRVRPSCAILVSDTATRGPGDSNANVFEHIAGDGYYTHSAVYLNNTADSTFIWCHPATQGSVAKPSWIITSLNSLGMTSPHVTLAPPSLTINLTFLNIGANGLVLENTYNVNFFGGSFDATTPQFCVKGIGNAFQRTGFYNSQFTANLSAPTFTGDALIDLDTTDEVTDLSFINPCLSNSVGPAVAGQTVAFIRTAATTVLREPIIIGLVASHTSASSGGFGDVGPASYLIDHPDHPTPGTRTLIGGQIDAASSKIRPGGKIDSTALERIGALELPASGAGWDNRTPGLTGEPPFGGGNFSAPSSGGWGAGSTLATVSGNGREGEFTIIAAGAPTIHPTLAISWPVPYSNPPRVTCTLVDGTGIVAAAAAGAHIIRCSSGPASCNFTFQGLTPVAGSSYVFRFRVIG